MLDRDVADPYRGYFGIGVLGWIGGGIRTFPVLGPIPYAIDLDLNDWLRFDRPGHYRLYLKSHRLMRERAPEEPGEGKTVQFTVASNIVEIDILPRDQNWEDQKLGEIRTTLEQPRSERHVPEEEKIVLARRELRYLGTQDAVRFVFEQARTSTRGPDTLAVIGAPNRAHAIAEFDRYLSDPEIGISEWDIRLRALFKFIDKEAPEVLPIFEWQVSGRSDSQGLIAIAETRQKRFEEFIRDEALRLIPLIARKEADARETSAAAIAATVPVAAKAVGLIPPDDYGLTREQLILQFVNLSAKQQSELLTRKWDLVRGPDMILSLRQVIDNDVQPKPLPGDATTLWVWGTENDLTEMALRRLNELAPREAAAILRRDIAGGKPRFPGFAVREFSAHDIPEADAAFSVLLKSNFRGALPLVAKFGSVKLAEQMRSLHVAAMWPCAEEESFTVYFVRTLPGDEAGQGRDILKRAMANRGQRACYRTLLSRISNVLWNPVIEAQAIETLNDPDPETTTSAVLALAAHGGPAVEPLLWLRLEKWSEKWMGRAGDLDAHPITQADPNQGEQRLGSALFQAIGSAKSWLVDEPRRQRLLALCVDAWCREQWSRELLSGPVRVDASSGGALYPTMFRVSGYAAPTFEDLKAKLQLFPAGTKFRWRPRAFNSFDAFTPGQRQRMFEELTSFLSKRWMNIEPYSEEKCSGVDMR